MNNYPTTDDIRAIVRAAERARARELSRLITQALALALDMVRRAFAARRIAVPE